jgi:hypothetical protein
MDDHSRLDRLQDQMGNWSRADFHDFREAINKIGITVALVEAKQSAVTEFLKELKADVREGNDYLRAQNGRIFRLEARMGNSEGREGDPVEAAAFTGKQKAVLWTIGITFLASAAEMIKEVVQAAARLAK